MLPSDPNNMNMYAGLIALGIGLFGCLLVRYSNRGQGVRPSGEMLSWIVYTRLGMGSKSFLGKQLDLGMLLDATVGELVIVSTYIAWLVIRFVYFYELYDTTYPNLSIRVGKSFGQLAPPMVLMEYLTAQRYTIWSWVSGIPHERLIGYHRIHGWAFYWVIFTHMVCMSVGTQVRVDGIALVRQVDDPLSIVQINPALGIAAFLCFTVTVMSSLEFVRRRFWGKFYLAHFSFFPAVSLALFHARVFNLPWFAAAVGFFYIDMGTRFYMKFMRKSKVEAATVLPEGVVKLTISTGESMIYEAGQYVWLAFPGVPGAGPLAGFAFHPYSISSAYKPGDSTYTVHMKAMGPGTWSDAVHRAVQANGVEAFKGGCRVGGPSGRFSTNPAHYERIVLVAGGIGAPPLFSLLVDIVGDAASGKGAQRRYPVTKQVTVIWVVPYEQCLTWFTDELEAALDSVAVAVDLHIYVTRGKSSKGSQAVTSSVVLVRPEEPTSERSTETEMQQIMTNVDVPSKRLLTKPGRPDLDVALAAVAATGEGPVGVFACGPETMLDEIKDAVVGANRKADRHASNTFHIHVEVFHF